MKRAFTLIELMIVIAVLTILMGMVFKLSSIGTDNWRRTATITRLQRLENCLSGYYSAFGNYPPVAKHGSYDIYRSLGAKGLQTDQRNENIWNWTAVGEDSEKRAWDQVKAACKCQPVDCRFPFPDDYSIKVTSVSEMLKERVSSGDWTKDLSEDRKRQLMAGFDDGVTQNINRHSRNKGKDKWEDIQLFKFGLMSFLLPRYLVMMNGNDVFFREYAQWTGNNDMPSDPFTGRTFAYSGGWQQVAKLGSSTQQSDLAKVANIPSQAVCARWMPNLEGICQVNHDYKLFGINIKDNVFPSALRDDNPHIEIFTPDDADSGSTANQYVLDGVTVCDGWWNEFYYYSPAPFQRYTLWSGGPNGRTFPPWVNRKKLSSKANECIAKWTDDDIIHMSN